MDKKSKLIVQYDLEFKFIHYYKQSKNAKRRHERVRCQKGENVMVTGSAGSAA